ncbi:fungal-specific transcription factor domain-containing protein [Lentinula aciculospora]|uniref:Fungal-specific transcription factor domain-containing protein n=1 Tax=Lentinula aciculospora TaxID=153920 RepID=A0A9W9AC65_9AGAR|nr:fungal-specific transcription factor domain-containing protein [Lentinula aciculospora]
MNTSMSSNEEDLNDGESSQSSKKRRIQRACDGIQMPGKQCSNCIAYNLDCTYVEAAKKRGPPKAFVSSLIASHIYIESLETRLDKMTALFRSLMPELNLAKELELGPGTSTMDANVLQRNNTHQDACRNTTTEAAISAIRRWDITPDFTSSQNAEDREHIELADNIKSLHIDSRDYRFFGKSSGAMLIKTAIDLKQEFTGRETDMKPVILGERRPQFWRPLPWEDSISDNPNTSYNFPEPDLLASLINSYFHNVNIILPLLHRPTFERATREKLHYRDDMFAAIVLLVCAVASRYVDDRRVLLDKVDSWHSSGWKYFNQVQVVRKSLLAPPTLFDLQFYCLSVQFLQGSSAPHSCWTMVGIGIRLAQDVGAHRRKPTKALTVESELWKRAFWVLVCMDRMFSTGLGRPCAIQDEDYDLDMPVECDDEYWEHPDPAMRFRQPPGKPSTVSAFNAFIKLNVLLSIALRTIYAINKSKILMGFGGDEWEQHIVAELDSALNQWVDSVPDHLRWDPNREDETFFSQSVMLYSQYYLVQILVHRPFIPSPKKPSPLSFPSLAICTNAARSASHITDVQRKRQTAVLPFSQISVFTAGIVLLLNIWGGKRSGLSTDTNKEMTDVYKCMEALKSCEEKWHSCGRLWDILYELASVGELPLPQNASPMTTNKRERGADSPISAVGTSESSPSLSDAPPSPDSRTIAGSRRVSAATSMSRNFDYLKAATSGTSLSHTTLTERVPSTDSPPGMQLFSLPVYSDELGRLPLHGQVNFSTRPHLNLQQSDWCPPPTGSSGLSMLGISTSSQYIPPEYYNFGFGESGTGHTSNPAPQGSTPYQNGFLQQSPQNITAGPGSSSMVNLPQQHASDGMLLNRDNVNLPIPLDSDTFAMWSNAPSGFELDDWGTYLSNVSELTQTMNRSRDSL